MYSSGPLDRRTLVCLSRVRTAQQDGFPCSPEDRQTDRQRDGQALEAGGTDGSNTDGANSELYLEPRVTCAASSHQCWSPR